MNHCVRNTTHEVQYLKIFVFENIVDNCFVTICHFWFQNIFDNFCHFWFENMFDNCFVIICHLSPYIHKSCLISWQNLFMNILSSFRDSRFMYTLYGPGNYLSRSRYPSLLLTVRVSGLLRFTALQSSCGMVRTGSKGECTIAVRPLLSLSRMKNYVEFVVLILFFGKTAR